MFILVNFILACSLAFAQLLPEPRGHYNSGAIKFSWELPFEGEGYVRLFVERNRGWGTQPMIEMIEKSAAEIHQLFPAKDRLQVGDISSKRGGRISRHSSHQNGLDVDLAFYRLNGVEQPTNYRGGFLGSMVRRGRLSRNFDIVRNWELIKALHRFGKVSRIFVDKVIKKEICRHAEYLGEKDAFQDVLRSLRPYPNHTDHLHVRIECPENALKCRNQRIPDGVVGC
jgi:penicillin-insensitive murein endopeptidase